MTVPVTAATDSLHRTARGTATLRASADSRLLPYCLIAIGGLVAAAVVGVPALAALAVPFALALALGLRRSGPVDVTAQVRIATERLVEGDPLGVTLDVAWEPDFDAEVVLHQLRGVTYVDGGSRGDAPVWSVAGGTGLRLRDVRLQAAQWGRHTPFEVWVRLSSPLGLLRWTGRVVSAPELRVLPAAEHLDRLLDPTESRAVLGMHRSRRIGSGGEFAEVRPYTPGDRLRDLNWRATGRYHRPFVNRYHPELSGDVLIAVDGFGDGSTASTEALTRAARAAWALASVHLRANDRVGLVGLGGRTEWLLPSGGRRARYRLLEALLRIGGEAAGPGEAATRRLRAVPVSALVIALTPLHDDLTVRALQAWRARGSSVAAVVVDTQHVVRPDSGGGAARRLWALEIERRKGELTELGIPVVTVTGEGPIAPVVAALRRARRAPAVRARRA